MEKRDYYDVSFDVPRWVNGRKVYTRFVVGVAWKDEKGRFVVEMFTIPTGICPVRLYFTERYRVKKPDSLNEIGRPPKFTNAPPDSQ